MYQLFGGGSGGVMEVGGDSFGVWCTVWGNCSGCRRCRRDVCFERIGGLVQSGHQTRNGICINFWEVAVVVLWRFGVAVWNSMFGPVQWYMYQPVCRDSCGVTEV